MTNDHSKKRRSLFSNLEGADIYNSLVRGDSVADVARRYSCSVLSIYQLKRTDWFKSYEAQYPDSIPEEVIEELKLERPEIDNSTESKSFTGKRGQRLTEHERRDIFNRLVVYKQPVKQVAKEYSRSEASIYQMCRSNWFQQYEMRY